MSCHFTGYVLPTRPELTFGSGSIGGWNPLKTYSTTWTIAVVSEVWLSESVAKILTV